MSTGGNFGIEVSAYSEPDRKLWEDFVGEAQQGTLFHTRAFLAYHPPARFADASLLFRQAGNLLAVLPAAVRLQQEQRILHSHPGASFGGFVTRPRLPLRETDCILAAFLIYCRAHGYGGAELTLPPQIYSSSPDHHLEYLLYRHGFQYRKREMTSAIPVDAPHAFWPRELRRAARRAQNRGVKITESDDWGSFYDLLQHHMWQRHQVSPTHTLAELMRLRELCPHKLCLFAAFVAQEMVAGILLFLCNRQAALAFYYVSQREGFQHYHGFPSLIAEVLQWCARQNLRYLDFGTYTINSEPNWGLADFKESFGAQGFLRDTLAVTFTPESTP